MRKAIWAVGLLTLLMIGCNRGVHEPASPITPAPFTPPAQAPAPQPYVVACVNSDQSLVLYQPATKTQTTHFADIESTVDYSADGRHAAYAASSGEVHLADLHAGTTEKLGTTDLELVMPLALSPDGTKVAWIEAEKVKVWDAGKVVSVTGPPHPQVPAWSPDSKKLAMGSYKGEEEEQDGGLWLWDGTGPAKLLVPPGPADEGSVSQIRWSPDGAWLAWSRGFGDFWTGDICKSDGTELRRGEVGAGPRQWLPDSLGLIVDVHVEAGAFSTGLYMLAERKVRDLGPVMQDTSSCLSPDGKRVIVFGPEREAVLITIDGSQPDVQWQAPGGVEAADWSPEDAIAMAVQDPTTASTRLWLSDPKGNATDDAEVELYEPVSPPRWIKSPQ